MVCDWEGRDLFVVRARVDPSTAVFARCRALMRL